MRELREIKELLKANTIVTKQVDKNLMTFVRDFRRKMKPDIRKNYFPDLNYKDMKLGIDNRGLLYDKNTLKILPREMAFKVYRYFYEQNFCGYEIL